MVPAFKLEKLLDEKISINEKLLIKFFKNFNNCPVSKAPFGFCLASDLALLPLMLHLSSPTEELIGYLRGCNEKEQNYSLCFGLLDECEKLSFDDVDSRDFSKCVEKLPISFENKWKLLNAQINYNEHIEELLSLIIPAADLIKKSENIYRSASDEFAGYYSDADTREEFRHKFKYYDVMNVVPSIFGFDQTFAIAATKKENDANESAADASAADAKLTTNTFSGIIKHIVSTSSRHRVSDLGNKLKTLSDNTRLEILFYLCSHKAYGQELCAKFGLQHPSISHHMSKLVVAGLVMEEVSGNKTYYTADMEGINDMINTLIENTRRTNH